MSGRLLPAGLVALTGALEVAVHGWDVARACGVDRPLPDELARALLAAAPSLISAEAALCPRRARCGRGVSQQPAAGAHRAAELPVTVPDHDVEDAYSRGRHPADSTP